ncbi:hypothetical protein N752_07570 [Desulforamulus aquiferis]|nr:hypothetical protein N752_07570 [Desulforamulus aquiferis]
MCQKLGLKPARVSTQILQRDRHAEYLCTLAIIASSLDKFATEIRNLQRTDILEAEEYFNKGQKGSSAMPHKRNPITAENVSGLARVVRANALVGLDNVPCGMSGIYPTHRQKGWYFLTAPPPLTSCSISLQALWKNFWFTRKT